MANERLEYLGDSVVSLIVSEALWSRFPTESEGGLTTRRAAIVSTPGLARIAARLDLGTVLRLGEGAGRAGEHRRGSVLAASLEALIGAIYLDRGLGAARDAFVAWAEPELADATPLAPKPSKSRLQELAIARTGHPPLYRLVSALGPDHAKFYVVEVSLDDVTLGRGEGRNRREAETAAAQLAVARLEQSGRESPKQSDREPE